MSTRREIIVEKYNTLIIDINNIYKKDISFLPSLDNTDLYDLIFNFNLIFGSYTDNFHAPLRNMLSIKNIDVTNEEYKQIYPLIHRFLIFFKTLV